MEQLSCPRGHIIGVRDCGHHQAIVYRCKTVLCPDCERIRAARATAAWQPTLEKLPNLKSLTLTIKNGGQLKERLKVLDESFRALLDFRIGRNNRYRIRRTVATALDRKIARGKLTRERGGAWGSQ